VHSNGKVEVKLSVMLIKYHDTKMWWLIKNYATKKYGSVKVWFHAFLTSELKRGEWSASCPVRCTAGEWCTWFQKSYFATLSLMSIYCNRNLLQKANHAAGCTLHTASNYFALHFGKYSPFRNIQIKVVYHRETYILWQTGYKYLSGRYFLEKTE
jgi:hypothetical protein